MNNELLPCPGCRRTDFDLWPCEWIDGSGENVVRCAWCHFAAPLKSWNTRPTAQAAAVDALSGFRFRRFNELGRDEITITCPNGNIVTVENKGRLENRVLYAIAQAAMGGAGG